jgi:hypothetical protein
VFLEHRPQTLASTIHVSELVLQQLRGPLAEPNPLDDVGSPIRTLLQEDDEIRNPSGCAVASLESLRVLGDARVQIACRFETGNCRWLATC